MSQGFKAQDPFGSAHQPQLRRRAGRKVAPSPSSAEVQSLLENATRRLTEILRDELFMAETPLEVQNVMESALESIGAALDWLASKPSKEAPSPPMRGGPTRQQGQFLAFIREFMMRNESSVAPSHAEFQRFFNLTPPSVNSMLIRLQQRGFIRRVPGRARAIEIILGPESIPPLERPFRF